MISLCAGKLLRLNTLLRITILVPGALHSRVKGELARYSLSEDETARLRVVHYGPASAAMVKDEDRGGMIPDAVNAFRDIYRLILKVVSGFSLSPLTAIGRKPDRFNHKRNHSIIRTSTSSHHHRRRALPFFFGISE